jgi:hypothetical protein
VEVSKVMKFKTFEVPIAISLIQLAEDAQHPFQKYFSFWAAFNNIYTLVGRLRGLIVQPDLDRNGNPHTELRWNYSFPKVKIPSEKQQISEAINQLDAKTKDVIIQHPSIRFFVDRTPANVTRDHDALGQLINGVLNITRTINPQLPVWSPIDKPAYESYITGNIASQEILAQQIIFLLYTVRNNLVHGGKNENEANDIRVVENSLPLLEIVVRSFILW